MAFHLDESIQLLERTPLALRALLSGLDDVWVHANEGPDTWSAYDVVGHLVDGEETDWLLRAKRILEHGEAVAFEPFDRFRHAGNKGKVSLKDLLDRFEDLRTKNLSELRSLNLTPEQFALSGQHPALGSVRMDQLLATWTVHDLGHLAQISRVMAKRWAANVGPWAGYLTILHR